MDALGERARRRARAATRETPRDDQPPAPEKKPRRRRAAAPAVEPTNVRIELVTERQGVLGYRYRRLVIEQQGRQATVKELRLQLDFDLQFELATKPRDLVKVRGRRLDAAEFNALWTAIQKLRPVKLSDHYDFLDSVNAEDLDETIGADGEPIAVSTGEEGPCCLTLEWDEKKEKGLRKRIVIERFREPEPEAAEGAKARRAPLAALCALIDNKLKAKRNLNYRRVETFAALAEEFASLRLRHYLNLRQFERRILEAFGAVKDLQAIPLLETELFAADSRVRLQALDALAAIGDEQAVPAIEGLIYDDETPVREKARKVLKTLKAGR
ncbi:MAG: HEAT repeat domain-containing protein [Planctomycetota bacterium]